MRIYLVRHGESVLNAKEEGYDKIPDHALKLTEKGHEQAIEAGKALNKHLRELEFDKSKLRMWVSPYTRARQTAEEISNILGLKDSQIREDDMLTEISFGLFDGLSKEEQQTLFPAEYAKYQKDRLEKGKFYARRPGGESALDVEIRLRIFFDTIFRDLNAGGHDTLIIVCHGAVINIFCKAFLHKSHEWFYAEKNPRNGSVLLIDDNEYIGYIHGGAEE